MKNTGKILRIYLKSARNSPLKNCDFFFSKNCANNVLWNNKYISVFFDVLRKI